ncbi:MAG: type I-U CRISPR-associated protein Cas8c [Syntrophobacteraceae bacterium]
MTYPKTSFSVNVDVRNSGQYFACCGLLELAHRLWPGAEGWFDVPRSKFAIFSSDPAATLQKLIAELSQCQISGVRKDQRQEKESPELKNGEFGNQGRELSDNEEDRLKELGILARTGAVQLQKPFNIALDWWQTANEDPTSPKTWAGRQEIHKIARASQDSLMDIQDLEDLMNHNSVMRAPKEYKYSKSDQSKVEPFYFDARRFAHPLDIGFSLDKQLVETMAYPAVELLSLIGLQRFRPLPSSIKWTFEYFVWSRPLLPMVASVAPYCKVLPGIRYRFELQFRDGKKRYKAFGFSTHMGGLV